MKFNEMTLAPLVTAALLLATLGFTPAPAAAQETGGGQPCAPRFARPCWPGPFVSVDRLLERGARKTGILRLRIEPSNAEVYVDRLYAGTVADFDGDSPRLALLPGRHLIQVRAPGHESLQFETRIQKAQITVYRGVLTPDAAAGN